MPELSFVTNLKNDTPVYVDLVNSHAATHIADHPELLDYVRDFLKEQAFHEPEVALQHDVGHTVGLCDVVETSAKDEIVYAKRLNRDTYTRFVKNRTAQPTSLITIVLRKNAKGDVYELWAAWIGPKVPSFPGDDREFPESRDFWSKHALVWGNQVVQEGTSTTKVPW